MTSSPFHYTPVAAAIYNPFIFQQDNKTEIERELLFHPVKRTFSCTLGNGKTGISRLFLNRISWLNVCICCCFFLPISRGFGKAKGWLDDKLEKRISVKSMSRSSSNITLAGPPPNVPGRFQSNPSKDTGCCVFRETKKRKGIKNKKIVGNLLAFPCKLFYACNEQTPITH